MIFHLSTRKSVLICHESYHISKLTPYTQLIEIKVNVTPEYRRNDWNYFGLYREDRTCLFAVPPSETTKNEQNRIPRYLRHMYGYNCEL